MDITKKKETEVIIDGEELKYVIERKGGNFKLRYSKSDIWSEDAKGSKIASLEDDGNGVTIKVNGHDGKEKIRLSYDRLEELFYLIANKIDFDEKEYQKMMKERNAER